MSGQGRKYVTLEQLTDKVINDQVHSIFLPESSISVSHYGNWVKGVNESGLPGVRGRHRPAVKFIHRLQVPESFKAPTQEKVTGLTYRVR